VFSNPGNPPLLGNLNGTFNFGGGLLTGSWEEVVLVDPLGVLFRLPGTDGDRGLAGKKKLASRMSASICPER
jgi:hypothetical protein